jgi:hypothetical protein
MIPGSWSRRRRRTPSAGSITAPCGRSSWRTCRCRGPATSRPSKRALALARRIAVEERADGRDRRKAERIVAWYETRAWDAAHAPAPQAGQARSRPAGAPSLAWIDGLVVIPSLFVVLELVGGVAVAVAASSANERIAAIAGAIFGATMVLALIAVTRLLQAVERNTGRGGGPPASRA